LVPEARFCRSCGVPLKTGSIHETDAPVSPRAQTIPLTGEGRATDGLTTDDSRPNASDTAKVGRAEIEQILRRVQAEYSSVDDGKKAAQDAVETAAPQTTMRRAPELAAAAQVSDASSAPATSSSVPATSSSASTARTRRLWPVIAVALLCIGLVTGVWALIHSRRAASAPDAGSASPAASDEKQLDSEQTNEAEAQPAPQPTVAAEPSPAVVAKSMEHPRVTRNEQQTGAPKVSGPPASESPTPSVTPTPAPKTNVAQIAPDDYYFKGLNMVNGRDPKNLNDGELTAALNYFLRAQGGTHSAEARRYADRLGKEFDRRRKR
jgi:hypothetical protein